MTIGINPLPSDAVALATAVLQPGCAPHARAREYTRVPQNWTCLFVAARLVRSVKNGGIIF